MQLYSGPLSLFSHKVEIALYEKGIDFERIEGAFTQTEGYRPKHPDVIATNSKGQVPVLLDRDLLLYHSTRPQAAMDRQSWISRSRTFPPPRLAAALKSDIEWGLMWKVAAVLGVERRKLLWQLPARRRDN